jgi:hypothetical protein
VLGRHRGTNRGQASRPDGLEKERPSLEEFPGGHRGGVSSVTACMVRGLGVAAREVRVETLRNPAAPSFRCGTFKATLSVDGSSVLDFGRKFFIVLLSSDLTSTEANSVREGHLA